MDIEHNLEVAKPSFLYFVENMTLELRQWIQYTGVLVESNRLYFTFKSSQNSMNFKVWAGVNVLDIEFKLLAKSGEIYNYFKDLKNSVQ